MPSVPLLGEMTTWWLVRASVAIPPHKDYCQQVTTDTLQLPGGSEKRLSSDASDIDLLKTPDQIRSRSNSLKSQNSSSKSAQVFQRAGSFRHKIKSDSLSSSHISEGNIAAKISLSGVPGLLPTNEEDSADCSLLRNIRNSASIVIQVDEAC